MAINEIPELLFNCLKTVNSKFNKSAYLDQFGAIKTNSQRVSFAYKSLRTHNLFFKLVEDKKDDIEATKLREDGNKLFVVGNYKEALKMYTSSIKIAKSKHFLALAYANRSACLYKLEMYEECLIDIGRAFAHNYPSEKISKLVKRQKEAMKQQKPAETKYENKPKIPFLEENNIIQCARDCVKIKYNEGFGRCVVATRNIEIGEVICVEKPYMTFIMNDELLHCHGCMEICYNPVPCQKCTIVLFCSEKCKKEASEKYHKFECSILKTLFQYGLSSVILPLRIAFLATRDFYQEGLDCDDDDVSYYSDRYKEIKDLEGHTENYPVVELFFKALIAASTLHLVQNQTEFFREENMDTLKEEFREILLLQLQIENVNSLYISETAPGNDNSTFAAGLYSFISLFNHSCNHNVLRFFYGSTAVLSAYKTIKEGQQCFISYGFSYEHIPKRVRQTSLKKQYFFDCKCKACEEDWCKKGDINTTSYLHSFGMDSQEYNFSVQLLYSHDVDIAKQFLPRVKKALKKCEQFEPSPNVLKLKNLLFFCLRTFGNHRRI